MAFRLSHGLKWYAVRFRRQVGFDVSPSALPGFKRMAGIPFIPTITVFDRTYAPRSPELLPSVAASWGYLRALLIARGWKGTRTLNTHRVHLRIDYLSKSAKVVFSCPFPSLSGLYTDARGSFCTTSAVLPRPRRSRRARFVRRVPCGR